MKFNGHQDEQIKLEAPSGLRPFPQRAACSGRVPLIRGAGGGAVARRQRDAEGKATAV